jgi:hypothetical protein
MAGPVMVWSSVPLFSARVWRPAKAGLSGSTVASRGTRTIGHMTVTGRDEPLIRLGVAGDATECALLPGKTTITVEGGPSEWAGRPAPTPRSALLAVTDAVLPAVHVKTKRSLYDTRGVLLRARAQLSSTLAIAGTQRLDLRSNRGVRSPPILCSRWSVPCLADVPDVDAKSLCPTGELNPHNPYRCAAEARIRWLYRVHGSWLGTGRRMVARRLLVATAAGVFGLTATADGTEASRLRVWVHAYLRQRPTAWCSLTAGPLLASGFAAQRARARCRWTAPSVTGTVDARHPLMPMTCVGPTRQSSHMRVRDAAAMVC